MGVCHFIVGGIHGAYGVPAPGGVAGNANVVIILPENSDSSHTVIAFSYLLIIIYALTVAPVAWIYASEVWSLAGQFRAGSLRPPSLHEHHI